MSTQNTEQIISCCDNDKIYHILVAGGQLPDYWFAVCKLCYQTDSRFTKFAIKIIDLITGKEIDVQPNKKSEVDKI